MKNLKKTAVIIGVGVTAILGAGACTRAIENTAPEYSVTNDTETITAAEAVTEMKDASDCADNGRSTGNDADAADITMDDIDTTEYEEDTIEYAETLNEISENTIEYDEDTTEYYEDTAEYNVTDEKSEILSGEDNRVCAAETSDYKIASETEPAKETLRTDNTATETPASETVLNATVKAIEETSVTEPAAITETVIETEDFKVKNSFITEAEDYELPAGTVTVTAEGDDLEILLPEEEIFEITSEITDVTETIEIIEVIEDGSTEEYEEDTEEAVEDNAADITKTETSNDFTETEITEHTADSQATEVSADSEITEDITEEPEKVIHDMKNEYTEESIDESVQEPVVKELNDDNEAFCTSSHELSPEAAEVYSWMVENIMNPSDEKVYYDGEVPYEVYDEAQTAVEKDYFKYSSGPFTVWSLFYGLSIDSALSNEYMLEDQFIRDNIQAIEDQIFYEGITERDAMKAIDEWFRYNYTYVDDVYTLYEAFQNGGGVCATYAMLTNALCNDIGIECYYVTGWADNGIEYGRHAWNKVKIDGTYCYVDYTWNPWGGYYLTETLWEDHEEEDAYTLYIR